MESRSWYLFLVLGVLVMFGTAVLMANRLEKHRKDELLKPCDTYGDLPIREVPARCLKYFQGP